MSQTTCPGENVLTMMVYTGQVPSSPTLRRRRLAAELRRLRESAGLTIDQAAKAAGISPSHLSRSENAVVGVRVLVVKALLATYGADPATTEYLVSVARDAGQRGWWQNYSGAISEQYVTYISFESEAVAIHNFEATVMPGLLQTPSYNEAMLKGGLTRMTDEEIASRVEVRLARQQILTKDSPPTLWFVLDEATVRRQVGGPKVMAEQLARVVELAALPHVDVQVVPFAVGAHPGTPGSFVALSFAEPTDPTVIYVETIAGDLYPEKESEVQGVMMAFNRLRAMALGPEESVKFILNAAKELK